MAGSPTSPIRAHHRFLLNVVSTHHKGYDPTPRELDRIASVFAKAGGSWAEVFEGSVRDIGLLRKVLKVAIKRGLVTRTSDWSK